MQQNRKIFFLPFLLLFFTVPLFAFTFEPITQDFTPSGLNSRRSFLVTNTGAAPVPIKVSVVTRDMDLYGKEIREDASSLFFVFPQQFVLQPRSSQAVRVQWNGPSAVQTERAFRIIAQQLPVPSEQLASGLTILITYEGTLYVTPPSFRYGLKVNSVTRSSDETGADLLLVELENTGNTHMILANPVLTLIQLSTSGIRRSFVLSGEVQLKGLINQNILAGKRRVFTVPWPTGLQYGELDATISIEPTR